MRLIAVAILTCCCIPLFLHFTLAAIRYEHASTESQLDLSIQLENALNPRLG